MRALRRIASRAKPAGARIKSSFPRYFLLLLTGDRLLLKKGGRLILQNPPPAFSYEAETTALLARFSVQPDETRALLINALIASLKTAGVWSKLDAFYVMAAHDAQAAQRNWIQNAYNLSAVSSPTFTTDRGYAGNGSSSYLDTGFNPVTAPTPKFVQNSASFGAWSRTSGQSSASVAGWFDGSDGLTLLPRSTADFVQGRINQASSTTYSANTDGAGLYALNRSGVSATQAYRNGAAWGTGSVASAALNSAPFTFGHVTAALYSAMQFSSGFIGSSLTAGEHAALYAALHTYLTAVGAA